MKSELNYDSGGIRAIGAGGYDALKRLGDVVFAGSMLLLFTPLMLLVAALVKLDSRGPALFRQRRVGRCGQVFLIYKFRTMVPNAEGMGPQVTSSDDPRMTRLGRILRATKIDELPQLLNVLKGDMSLVGPRPQVPRYVELFPDSQRSVILSVRPGITGPTALIFRHEEDILHAREDREEFYKSVLLPIKCDLDVQYVKGRSLRRDTSVLWQTGAVLARGVAHRIMRRPMGQNIEYPIPSFNEPASGKEQAAVTQ